MKNENEQILAKHSAGYWKTGCLEEILVSDALLQKVFVIENGSIVEKRLLDFESEIEHTPRSLGVGAQHFVEFHESGVHAGHFVCVEVIGWGGHKHVFDRFDTAFEAVEHIEKIWASDIHDSVDFYYTRDAAQIALDEMCEAA